jgi:LacI family transcriptional regulator
MTVKEIAEHVGVSRATVYRVINNYPYVNPEIRKKIQELIHKYDCSPNAMGKALAMHKKRLKIVVIVSDRTASFYRDISTGVYQAYERIKDAGIELEILEKIDDSPGKEAEAIYKAIASNAAAVAICPIDSNNSEEAFMALQEKEIPYVTFGSDYKTENRLFFVGHKNYQSGRTSGYMMDCYLQGKGKILMVKSLFESEAHIQRCDGFCQYLSEKAPGLEIVETIVHGKDNARTYMLAQEAFRKHPDIAGVYIISRGTDGVVKVLRELGLEKKVRVITYDLTDAHIKYLESEDVDMVIWQDPVTQGRMAVEKLYEYLISGKKPYDDCYLTETVMVVKESLFY